MFNVIHESVLDIILKWIYKFIKEDYKNEKCYNLQKPNNSQVSLTSEIVSLTLKALCQRAAVYYWWLSAFKFIAREMYFSVVNEQVIIWTCTIWMLIITWILELPCFKFRSWTWLVKVRARSLTNLVLSIAYHGIILRCKL